MFGYKETKFIKAVPDVLEYFSKSIGHNNWFISGSYANSKITNASDIDVFFCTQADYDSAVLHITKLYATDTDLVVDSVTSHSTTFYIRNISVPVQFIQKSFGTPDKIFDTFDLNVCKRALLPNGTKIVHKSADQELRVEKVNYNTFSRYFKYADRLYSKKEVTRLGKKLIDTFIHDLDLLESYYDRVKTSKLTNDTMFKEACYIDSLKSYAYEQAKIHAPELLV
jgi:hypothetical protein